MLKRIKNVYWKGSFSLCEVKNLINNGREVCKKFSRYSCCKEAIELDRYVNALALKFLLPAHYHLNQAKPKEVLGLSKDLAAKNPDLADFLQDEAVRAPRGFFQHYKITHEQGEPLLPFQGRFVKWNAIKKQIFGFDMPNSFKLPHGWKYIEEGIVHKDLVKWEKLEPCWKEKAPAEKGHFYLELVSKERAFLGFGRHCWMRLIDDKGNVISVGFLSKANVLLPFRSQKGRFLSPDPWEFKHGTEYSVRFPMDHKQFEKVKSRIESDQKNKNLFFNTITRNCSTYACEILREELGISIDNREFPSEMLFRKITDLFGIKLPNFCKKAFIATSTVFNYIISFFMSILILLLGGCYTDKEMKDLQKEKGEEWAKKLPRPFSSITSLFDGSNFFFSTGWKITEWQKEQKGFQKKVIPTTIWNK